MFTCLPSKNYVNAPRTWDLRWSDSEHIWRCSYSCQHWRTTYSDWFLQSWSNLSCHCFISNKKYFYTSHSVSRTLIYEWRSAKISTETASYWFSIFFLFLCFYSFRWLKLYFIAQRSTEHRFTRLHLGPLPLFKQTLKVCHSASGPPVSGRETRCDRRWSLTWRRDCDARCELT